MAASLAPLLNALAADPGLKSKVPLTERQNGLTAAQGLNQLLLQTIALTGVNADGQISAADLMTVSAAIRANPTTNANFIALHGDDECGSETGYHLLQNDGGTLVFRGLNFVDTVADAIYHFGFAIQNGRYLNEDGNANEKVTDVAGWLNYFLNGTNLVYGGNGADELYSASYSELFASARDETFLAGTGDDSIWADIGNDKVYGGAGDDVSAGGTGNDWMEGGTGSDSLWGEDGADTILGGSGRDILGGGAGDDSMDGGTGADTLWADAGADTLKGGNGADLMGGGADDDLLDGGASGDTLYGDTGNDTILAGDGNDSADGGAGNDSMVGGRGADSLYGSSGDDQISGDAGADTLYGADGADVISGGAGRDTIYLWEKTAAADTLIFAAGDSGGAGNGGIDYVEGFQSGSDHIDLTAFGAMAFATGKHGGGGQASAYYDGKYLHVDGNGDGVSDMLVEFAWVKTMVETDFIFA